MQAIKKDGLCPIKVLTESNLRWTWWTFRNYSHWLTVWQKTSARCHQSSPLKSWVAKERVANSMTWWDRHVTGASPIIYGTITSKRAPAKNLNRERPSLQQHLAESQLHLTANGFLIGTYTSGQTRNWLSVSGTWWKVGRLVIGHVLFMSISILYCVGALKGFWRSCVRRFLATGALCSWV